MINSIKKYIQKNIIQNRDEELKFIQISSSPGKDLSRSRIIAIFFKENDERPFLVCKFAKLKNYEYSIINEYNNTKQLYDCLPDIFAKPLGLIEIDDRIVFIQEFIDGKTISNLIYEAKNSPSYTQHLLESIFIESLNDMNYLLCNLNIPSKKSDSETIQQEIEHIKEEFCKNFKLNYYEYQKLNKSIEELLKLFTNIPITKRITHFDFTPFNIIKKTNGQVVLIDLETCKESTLTIIEPLRFFYYLYKDMFDLGLQKYTENLIYSYYLFLCDLDNKVVKEFNKILKEKYYIEINRATRKLLCLIYFMIEANMQYDVQIYISKEFINTWKRYINYFTDAYSEGEIFEYENSLLTELKHFIAIKDIQLDECQKAVEMLNEKLAIETEKYMELINEKEKIINELETIIQAQNNHIRDIKLTKVWRIAEIIRKIIR
ncbi:hypothetical protein [Thermotalea metallivorans]|uniref:Aminoglycoside phosphotransferase domain-containing protein n=1 Tax=Thermotalea metallivorans TaxID=520762 RepID=A0A140L6W2_9FIRM|nr:hypothetical protein [Thermotalea metallivorans]KXG76287.1 hypothetical protein AN619_12440 [Thermotalea metallivorans]